MTESTLTQDRPGVDEEAIDPQGIDSLEDEPSTTRNRLAVRKTYKLYIHGQFTRTESGRYDPVMDPGGEVLANACRGSRKDFRDAVVAARAAQSAWAGRSAFNRGQILYRMAEMLEGRAAQFEAELAALGSSAEEAAQEVATAVDRLVYYAGWCDKYQQVFSSVNPVSSSHFNFTILEPTGVVAIFAPNSSGLLGLVSVLSPVIAGGNTAVLLASQKQPLCAISFAEVVDTSDVPAGVVNILTGRREELLEHFASHMDVNALLYCGSQDGPIEAAQRLAAGNVKRVIIERRSDWATAASESPYSILACQETKTTWHPIGT